MDKVIGIISASGGVGKSAVAALLGREFSSRGSTAAVELGSSRSLDIMLGADAAYDIRDVFEDIDTLDDALSPTDHPGLSLIQAADERFEADPELFESIVNRLRADYDYVVIDTQTGNHKAADAAAKTADSLVMVITLDSVCIRESAKMADYLETKHGKKILLALNKIELPIKSSYDLDAVIDQIGCRLIGILPYDKNIFAAGAKPGKKTAWAAARNITKRLMGIDVPLMFR
ncbi:MAG: hypothetical protein FWH14_03560 [Oscillospiraceae bacterium]|nr:hypothetical protein [Oscillospiraceae bacterium]